MTVFGFLDEISEVKRNESLTAFFTLKGSEEFLKDHFAGFPVMPGVLQLESLRQAASRLLTESGEKARYRLQKVASVKYGQFVKPGSRIKIFVQMTEKHGGTAHFEGRVDLAGTGRTVLADFTLAAV